MPAVALAAVLAMAPAAHAESLGQMLGFGAPAAQSGQPARVALSQEQQLGQLIVQLQQLQEQVRTLTGRVDGLQFQVSQMQAQLQRQQGGSGTAPRINGPTEAPLKLSPQSSAAPDGPAVASRAPIAADSQTDMSATDNDVISEDQLGKSQDPLVGTNAAPGATAPLAPGTNTAALSQPLNLSLKGSTAKTDPDAEAQYKAGYEAVAGGDYATGEDQLRQFLKLYPDDAHAPEATDWLGEALLRQRHYDDAAQVLVDGFKKYRDQPIGADILLKLGMALEGANEGAAACKTFAEVKRRYPDSSPGLLKQLQQETAKAKCAG